MSTNDLYADIDVTDAAELCRELVRIDTTNPPGNELAAAELVLAFLKPYGFTGELIGRNEGRATAIARLRGSGGVPPLMFNGHLDVVPPGAGPWTYPPFAGAIADGRVWGRGAADMKGGLAALLIAARALARSGLPLRGDLIVSATIGEEVDMCGARELASLPALRDVQAIIVAEPTGNRLGLAERGVFQPVFTTYGKTAHASTPELGRNAIMMMVELLSALERLEIPFTPHPVLGAFTQSVGTIQGGVKVNVVPDRCTAVVDMRTVPGQDHAALLSQLRALLREMEQRLPGFRASVASMYDLPPVETPTDAPAVQQFCAAAQEATGRAAEMTVVRFATEGAIFIPALGAPTLIFGPGDPALAHQPDESIEIDRMAEAARIYALAGARLLS